MIAKFIRWLSGPRIDPPLTEIEARWTVERSAWILLYQTFVAQIGPSAAATTDAALSEITAYWAKQAAAEGNPDRAGLIRSAASEGVAKVRDRTREIILFYASRSTE